MENSSEDLSKFKVRTVIQVSYSIVADSATKAEEIAERISYNIISRCGAGYGQILELESKRSGRFKKHPLSASKEDADETPTEPTDSSTDST